MNIFLAWIFHESESESESLYCHSISILCILESVRAATSISLHWCNDNKEILILMNQDCLFSQVQEFLKKVQKETQSDHESEDMPTHQGEEKKKKKEMKSAEEETSYFLCASDGERRMCTQPSTSFSSASGTVDSEREEEQEEEEEEEEEPPVRQVTCQNPDILLSDAPKGKDGEQSFCQLTLQCTFVMVGKRTISLI